jgi:hypothetical protein
MKRRIAAMLFTVILSLGVQLAGAGRQESAPTVQDELKRCMEGLRAGDPWADDCLAKMGPPAAPAVLPLIEMLADAQTFYWDSVGPDGRMTGGSRNLRWSASNALLHIGEPSIQPLIEALAGHRDPRVREGAAQVLGLFGDRRVLEPLIRALADAATVPDSVGSSSVLRQDGPRRVNDSAAGSLVSSKAAGIGDALVAHLDDSVAAVREGVVAVLVARKDPRSVPIVMGRLKDSHWRARATAVNQISKLSPPGIVELLLGLLKDADIRVRIAVIDNLGQLDFGGGPRTAPPEEARVRAALAQVERQAWDEYNKSQSLDSRAMQLSRLAEHAGDAQRAIAERRKP